MKEELTTKGYVQRTREGAQEVSNCTQRPVKREGVCCLSC
jgi:hypothetical protein